MKFAAIEKSFTFCEWKKELRVGRTLVECLCLGRLLPRMGQNKIWNTELSTVMIGCFVSYDCDKLMTVLTYILFYSHSSLRIFRNRKFHLTVILYELAYARRRVWSIRWRDLCYLTHFYLQSQWVFLTDSCAKMQGCCISLPYVSFAFLSEKTCCYIPNAIILVSVSEKRSLFN